MLECKIDSPSVFDFTRLGLWLLLVTFFLLGFLGFLFRLAMW